MFGLYFYILYLVRHFITVSNLRKIDLFPFHSQSYFVSLLNSWGVECRHGCHCCVNVLCVVWWANYILIDG